MNQISFTEIYQRNPREGFELIYNSVSGKIMFFLKRSFYLSQTDAEDLIHEIFLPWVETPEKMAVVENPVSYLFACARNLALKLKKREKAAEMMHEEMGFADRSKEAPKTEEILDIQRALETLPEDQRETLILRVWGEMTIEEVSENQGIPYQTVASRYRYAIQKMKEVLNWDE